MQPQANGRFRLRRDPAARAYESKSGGWTLVTSQGLYFELAAPAAVMIWEAVLDDWIDMDDVLMKLVEHFPQVDPIVIFSDLMDLVRSLAAWHFVQTTGRPPEEFFADSSDADEPSP